MTPTRTLIVIVGTGFEVYLTPLLRKRDWVEGEAPLYTYSILIVGTEFDTHEGTNSGYWFEIYLETHK